MKRQFSKPNLNHLTRPQLLQFYSQRLEHLSQLNETILDRKYARVERRFIAEPTEANFVELAATHKDLGQALRTYEQAERLCDLVARKLGL